MASENCKLIDHGFDWFTGTQSQQKEQLLLLDRCAQIFEIEYEKGNEKQLWSMAGYQGFKCGGIQFGTRPDSACVRLSGPTAEIHWEALFPLCSNVSRVDFQVTVRWSEPGPRVIARCFRNAMRYHKQKKCTRTVALYRSSDQSATIYLGKRISDRFGRIYQKDKESKLDHYDNCLRYELELKNELAWRAAHHIYGDRSAGVTIYNVVRQWFLEAGCLLPPLADNQTALKCISVTASDSQRKLAWLESNVRPAIEYLRDNGYLDDCLKALGLKLVDGDTGPIIEQD